MQVGMVLQLPAPGVENAGTTWQICADEAGIGSKFFYRRSRRPEHDGIGQPLVGEEEGADLGGHGEGEQEMVAWQSPGQLGREPLPCFEVLTLGAVPVAAGSFDDMGFTAIAASIDGGTVYPGTALDDGREDFLLLFWQVGMVVEKLLAIGSEDLGDGSHAHTSRIRLLMMV